MDSRIRVREHRMYTRIWHNVCYVHVAHNMLVFQRRLKLVRIYIYVHSAIQLENAKHAHYSKLLVVSINHFLLSAITLHHLK